MVFQDLNNSASFLVKSTARTKETIKHKDGQTYPLVKLHITSASHPFYTGQEKMIDVEGRIDKFKSRRQAAEKAKEQLKAKSLKALKRSEREGQEREKQARAKKAVGRSRPGAKKSDRKAGGKPARGGDSGKGQPAADSKSATEAVDSQTEAKE